MVYQGANIYCWGNAEQTRLLLNGVKPWTVRARQQGWASRFWYSRFDARGPHVFLLWGTTPESLPALRSSLQREIEAFLRQCPSTEVLSAEQIERRHRECRGNTMSVADREPGLASNNSFVLFTHDPGDYPLHLSTGMADAPQFWKRIDDLSCWVLEQLQDDTAITAVRWVAAVDRSLARTPVSAESYWRFHASTLVLPLRERLQTNEAEVLKSLPRIISPDNQRLFANLWNQSINGNSLGFDVEGLVRLILCDQTRPLDSRFQTLRAVIHTVIMGQLGLWTKFEIPIILYAWNRNVCV